MLIHTHALWVVVSAVGGNAQKSRDLTERLDPNKSLSRLPAGGLDLDLHVEIVLESRRDSGDIKLLRIFKNNVFCE